jgi:hypothetical protein
MACPFLKKDRNEGEFFGGAMVLDTVGSLKPYLLDKACDQIFKLQV